MGNSYDVIVIGVGAMGAAACHQLARRNVRVLGLEQFDIPHNLGSSHGNSRLIRLAYYENPNYVPLLIRAYELWDELERSSGQKLLHITGGVYLGDPQWELVSQSAVSARKHNLPHEILSHEQLKARWPQFELPKHFVGFFEQRAGFLLPERVIQTYARSAMQSGAEIHGREPVRDWSVNSSGVTVRTELGEYRADKLIFCAGAWTSKLLHGLGVKLVVTRQMLNWFWPRVPARFELGQFPVWGMDRPGGGIYYGFPMSSDDLGLKVAIHDPGEAVDPDTVDRHPRRGESDELSQFLWKHLPDGGGPVISQRVCMYTNTPDCHFVIDKHPRHERVVIACGFSGHGFKFASVVGEILADFVTAGRTRLPVEFLSLKRFR
jgi:sarcosine oxidase